MKGHAGDYRTGAYLLFGEPAKFVVRTAKNKLALSPFVRHPAVPSGAELLRSWPLTSSRTESVHKEQRLFRGLIG